MCMKGLLVQVVRRYLCMILALIFALILVEMAARTL